MTLTRPTQAVLSGALIRGPLTVALLVVVALAACGQAPSAHHRPAEAAIAATSAGAPVNGPASGTASETAGVAAAAGAPALQVGHNAWVDVSVATLWRTPASPRRVDAPALAHPVQLERWLGQMTLTERRALNGRADTQALLGDRVRVVRLRPGWARVVVPSQPSQLDPRGYPGWVPRRQLTAIVPTAAASVATVVRRTAWLRTDQPESRRWMRISFGTVLPVVGRAGRSVRVATPTGSVRRIPAGVVVVHKPGEPAVAPSRASLVQTAKSFVGLEYLWSGLSGFGIDCSGLTWLDYRVHGIRIPRDALPQSQHGTKVRAPRPGDLMFYAASGKVHHVSMYVGGGQMVHAPGTGQRVQVIATSTPAYRQQYAGARRYLP